MVFLWFSYGFPMVYHEMMVIFHRFCYVYHHEATRPRAHPGWARHPKEGGRPSAARTARQTWKKLSHEKIVSKRTWDSDTYYINIDRYNTYIYIYIYIYIYTCSGISY